MSVTLGRLLLKASFDNISLLVSDSHAALQLLLHDGILGDETR